MPQKHEQCNAIFKLFINKTNTGVQELSQLEYFLELDFLKALKSF